MGKSTLFCLQCQLKRVLKLDEGNGNSIYNLKNTFILPNKKIFELLHLTKIKSNGNIKIAKRSEGCRTPGWFCNEIRIKG